MRHPRRIKEYVPISLSLAVVSSEHHNHLLMIHTIFWTIHYLLLGYYCSKIHIQVEYKCAVWNSDLPKSFASDVADLLQLGCLLFRVTKLRYGKNFNCRLFLVMELGFRSILKGFSLLLLISEDDWESFSQAGYLPLLWTSQVLYFKLNLK